MKYKSITLATGVTFFLSDEKKNSQCKRCRQKGVSIYPIAGLLSDISVDWTCEECIETVMIPHPFVLNCVACYIPMNKHYLLPEDALMRDQQAYCWNCYGKKVLQDLALSVTPPDERDLTIAKLNEKKGGELSANYRRKSKKTNGQN